MLRKNASLRAYLLCLILALPVYAQQPAVGTANVVVPPMVKFSGALADVKDKASTRVVGVTFSLYKDSQGGSPLWMETQNVQPDKTGHYSVMLGSTTSQGLPVNLFANGEARWLGVQPQGQAEQPRILLMSVPYALKALDAETIGGKPASSFQLVSPGPKNGSAAGPAPADQANEIRCTSGSACKKSSVPVFASNGGSATVSDSIISQSGANIKIAGAETVTGNVSSSGNVSAANVTASSNVIGGTGSFSVNSSGPTLNLANSGTGDGIDVSAAGSLSSGVHVAGTYYGLFASGGQFPVVGESGNAEGVFGSSATDSNFVSGVVGVEGGTNTETVGVYGYTSSGTGMGVYGQNVSGSSVLFLSPYAGVWGDSSAGEGLLGTSDSYFAIQGINNTDLYATLELNNQTTDTLFGNLLSAYDSNGGNCIISAAGDLGCSGSKSAYVPVDSGSRKVALYAVEAPENWFEDFGTARLSAGSAMIRLEPTFAQTVNTGTDYHVFLTPKGDCKGLYVTNEASTGFEVRELGGGNSNVAFDYRIVARRKGYENMRMADVTERVRRATSVRGSRMAQPTHVPAPVRPEIRAAAHPVAPTR